jgi:tellurite methyltransferase
MSGDAMLQPARELREQFGGIDIYLFDQLHRGRITYDMRVLDAGCGGGRNLVYLMQRPFAIWGVDERAEAVEQVRALAASLAPTLDPQRFQVARVDASPHSDASMDVVISSAVMHFARNEAHWTAMLDEMWRVLAPGGLFFCRLATTVGQDGKLQPLGGGRFIMPDGAERYLVDHETLIAHTNRLGGSLLDSIKSSVVHDQRSMGTWVVRKSSTTGCSGT